MQAFVDFNLLRDGLGEEVSQLWSDTFDFMKEARPDRPRVSSGRTKRLMRATVLTAAAAFEAVTNFLAELVAQMGQVNGRKVSESEVDCLREKRKMLQGGKLREKKQIYSSKERFLLVYDLVGGGQELSEKVHC